MMRTKTDHEYALLMDDLMQIRGEISQAMYRISSLGGEERRATAIVKRLSALVESDDKRVALAQWEGIRASASDEIDYEIAKRQMLKERADQLRAELAAMVATTDSRRV